LGALLVKGRNKSLLEMLHGNDWDHCRRMTRRRRRMRTVWMRSLVRSFLVMREGMRADDLIVMLIGHDCLRV
jgi:hypothetical protein